MALPPKYGIGAVVPGDGEISNLDFHSNGQYLVSSSGQSTLHFIDCLSGEEKKKLYCKSTGIGRMIFSHHESSVLISSHLKPYDIRYLSIYENRYINKFSGHREYVSSLSMCPVDDTFLSASEDNTVRRWDLVSNKEVARVNLPMYMNTPIVRFDSSGVVFGVMSSDKRSINNNFSYYDNLPVGNGSIVNSQNINIKRSIKLFDARSFDAAPFQDIAPNCLALEKALTGKFSNLTAQQLSRYVTAEWTSFQFSHEGTHVLVNTDSDIMWLVDSFRPEELPIPILARNINKQYFTNENKVGENTNTSMINNTSDLDMTMRCGYSFTTDDRYILSGNNFDSNEITVIDGKSLDYVQSLSGHVSNVMCIASNPKYHMFASGCLNTALWLPLIQQ